MESQQRQGQTPGELLTNYGATGCVQDLPPIYQAQDKRITVWRGSGGDERIWWCTDIDVRNAYVYAVPGTSTSTLPALAFNNGLLYMAWKGERVMNPFTGQPLRHRRSGGARERLTMLERAQARHWPFTRAFYTWRGRAQVMTKVSTGRALTDTATSFRNRASPELEQAPGLH